VRNWLLKGSTALAAHSTSDLIKRCSNTCEEGAVHIWTLRLLEEKVVELQIVDRASDSTIGRVLKKVSSSPIPKSAG
jgi:hypothetical protein